MITLISSKKPGVCNDMKTTVLHMYIVLVIFSYISRVQVHPGVVSMQLASNANDFVVLHFNVQSVVMVISLLTPHAHQQFFAKAN